MRTFGLAKTNGIPLQPAIRRAIVVIVPLVRTPPGMH
jgi:hypothetical protein